MHAMPLSFLLVSTGWDCPNMAEGDHITAGAELADGRVGRGSEIAFVLLTHS